MEKGIPGEAPNRPGAPSAAFVYKMYNSR